MVQKIRQKFFVFQIIAFELGLANSHKIEQDTCYRQSMCQQTPLTFNLTLGDIFSKSTSIKVMEKYDKSTLMEIWQVFGTLSHVDCVNVLRKGASHRVV